jgi:hypothetical protein
MFLSGAIAGSVNGFLVAPIELIRTRQITMKAKHYDQSPASKTLTASNNGNFWVCLRDILREGGMLGLWRSVIPAIVRDGPGIGIYLLTFDVMKKWLSQSSHSFEKPPSSYPQSSLIGRNISSSRNDDHPHDGVVIAAAQPKLWMKLVAGSCAGITYWMFALPVDTMKTLIEHSSTVAIGLPALGRHMYVIISDGGIIRLFRAWPVAFGRGIPAAAVTLTSYDLISEYLVERRLKHTR